MRVFIFFNIERMSLAKRSTFVEDLDEEWAKYFDNEKNKFYFYNKVSKKSSWISPDFGPCKNCHGWGKGLVNMKSLLCRRCTSAAAPGVQMPEAAYEKLGPCFTCKGYGKALVNQYGYCRRCYNALSKTQQLKLHYSGLELQKQASAPGPAPGPNSHGERVKAIDNLLKEYQKLQGALKEPGEEAPMVFQLGTKRKPQRSAFANYQEAVDPLAIGVGGDQYMSRAADDTAEGALYEQRPLPNPRKVLQEMEKKRRMY